MNFENLNFAKTLYPVMLMLSTGMILNCSQSAEFTTNRTTSIEIPATADMSEEQNQNKKNDDKENLDKDEDTDDEYALEPTSVGGSFLTVNCRYPDNYPTTPEVFCEFILTKNVDGESLSKPTNVNFVNIFVGVDGAKTTGLYRQGAMPGQYFIRIPKAFILSEKNIMFQVMSKTNSIENVDNVNVTLGQYDTDETEEMVVSFPENNEETAEVITNDDNEDTEEVTTNDDNEDTEEVITNDDNEDTEEVTTNDDNEDTEEVITNDDNEDTEEVTTNDDNEDPKNTYFTVGKIRTQSSSSASTYTSNFGEGSSSVYTAQNIQTPNLNQGRVYEYGPMKLGNSTEAESRDFPAFCRGSEKLATVGQQLGKMAKITFEVAVSTYVNFEFSAPCHTIPLAESQSLLQPPIASIVNSQSEVEELSLIIDGASYNSKKSSATKITKESTKTKGKTFNAGTYVLKIDPGISYDNGSNAIILEKVKILGSVIVTGVEYINN